MRIWKKAFSAAVTAALIASLTASGAFATKGTAGQSDQTDVLDCSVAIVISLATCSSVADGLSIVTLVGDDDDGTAGGYTTYISASGAAIIGVGAGGDFVLAGGIVTAVEDADLNDANDSITLRAPAVAGTATVTVYHISTVNGTPSTEGTLTISFSATSGLGVSAANSAVALRAAACVLNGGGTGFINSAFSSAPASPTATNVAHLCILVRDGNGTPVQTAVGGVGATITPVGLLVGLSTGQTTTATTDATGLADILIRTTGIAGVGTIGVSVTVGTTSTTFAPTNFTFTGVAASIDATSSVMVVYFTDTDTVVEFTAKDAAGNIVPVAGADTLSSDPTVFTIDSVETFDGVASDPGSVDVACLKVGSANVTVKQGSVASSAIKVYCSDYADSFSVAFDKATIAPAGSATFTVTVLDENGQPAADDGTSVTVIVSSGATSPTSYSDISDGARSFTFLAPFNTGVVTALATVEGFAAGKSAQINVGAVVPAVGVGTNASALGTSHTGTYSTATKVAALNKYQTFKISYGAGAAGQTVGILVATKNAAGVWSSFTRLTGRVADATGTAWFSWRSSAVSWISVRGDLGGSLSNAVQARWR